MAQKIRAAVGIALFWGILVFLGINGTIFPVLLSHDTDYDPIAVLDRHREATIKYNDIYFKWLEEQPQVRGLSDAIPSTPAPSTNRGAIPLASMAEDPAASLFHPIFSSAVLLNPKFFQADPLPPPYLDFHGFSLVPLLPKDQVSAFFPSFSGKQIAEIPTLHLFGREYTSFGMLHALAAFAANQASLRVRRPLAFLVGLVLTIIVTIARFASLTEEQIAGKRLLPSVLFLVCCIVGFNVFIPNITNRGRVDSYFTMDPKRFSKMSEEFRRYVPLLEQRGLLSSPEAQKALETIPEPPRR